ncbi:hypothetical protein [Microbulbifer sp.]|uniref:hypothetical protein n=1 Tax=Microbulbifer sp. TaxID=1908541 RepID=UPI0025889E68|nr:hypothetical protein [Microbulbifer sp.]
MCKEAPTRHLLIITLASILALAACDRKSETHDPDTQPTDTPTSDQSMEDTVVIDENDTSDDTTGSDDSNTGAAAATGDSDEVLICTKEWFEWVNNQVLATSSEMIAEQYPTGLPDVGSDEWFMAVDKLTGGDGAHGPDGGSDEWCMMVQQRLQKTE